MREVKKSKIVLRQGVLGPVKGSNLLITIQKNNIIRKKPLKVKNKK